MMGTRPQQVIRERIIHLYPCVDDILYAPLYIAIHALGCGPGAKPVDKVKQNGKVTEFLFQRPTDETAEGPYEYVTVRLHEALGGDEKVVDALLTTANSDSEVHIGIGDPAAALERNADAGTAAGGPQYVLLHTFVTRVALWAIARKRGFVRGDLEHLPKKVKELIERLSVQARDLAERSASLDLDLFLREHQFWPLTLGYSKEGKTTSAVVDAFARQAFEIAEKSPKRLGLEEVTGVVRGDYDVTLTYAPWLLELALIREGRREELDSFYTLPVFQGVSYPFTGLFVHIRSKEEFEGARDLIDLFLCQVMTSLTLMSRYRRTARALLIHLRHDMRWYGLDTKDRDDVLLSTIRQAFRELVFANCYSDSFDIPLFSWDLRTGDQRQYERLSRAAMDSVEILQEFGVPRSHFLGAEIPETVRSIVGEMKVERAS